MVLKDGYTSGSLLGEGWKQVEEWPDAARKAAEVGDAAGGAAPAEARAMDAAANDDDDEYTDEEEEFYVTLDLGHHTDRTIIGSSNEYQLVGMDTPTPFLKIGDAIFRGTADHIVGDELLLRDVRDPNNAQQHSHIPFATTRSQRITFEQVDLVPKAQVAAEAAAAKEREEEHQAKDAKKKRRKRPVRTGTLPEELPKQASLATGTGTEGDTLQPDEEGGATTVPRRPEPARMPSDQVLAGQDEGGPSSAGEPAHNMMFLKGYTANGRKIGRPVGSKSKQRKVPRGMPRLVDWPAEGSEAGSSTAAAAAASEAAPGSTDEAAPAEQPSDIPLGASSDQDMLQTLGDSDAEMADVNLTDSAWIQREMEDAAKAMEEDR